MGLPIKTTKKDFIKKSIEENKILSIASEKDFIDTPCFYCEIGSAHTKTTHNYMVLKFH
jgi:hypothetical protein